MAEQKKNIFGKVKDWWKNLDEADQMGFKIAGVWFFDGLVFGSVFTAVRKNRQMKNVAKISASKGYMEGRMDSYREIIQDPYFQMNNGMNKLEKQGKAQRF